MSGIAVVGSANLDLVFRSSVLPRPGETLLGGSFATHPGGKGANQAVAAARLGGPVSFVGAVGKDANGEVLAASLSGAGVDVTYLAHLEGVASGTAAILVGEDAQNMIVVAPGANNRVRPEAVRAAIASIQPSIVLAQLEIPLESVVAASESGARFILNPAPARDLPDDLLRRVDVLTPNETELEVLTGIAPVDDEACLRACHQLLERGVTNVVVTLGDRGSFWARREDHASFAALKIQPIDTTAAGDAFNGALAWRLALGDPLSAAIPMANAVGAFSATRHGAQEAMPTLEELNAFVAKMPRK